jgi:hypothetical protein
LQFAEFGLSKGNPPFCNLDVVAEKSLFIHCNGVILDEDVCTFVETLKFIDNPLYFLLLLINTLRMGRLREHRDNHQHKCCEADCGSATSGANIAGLNHVEVSVPYVTK